MSCGSCKSILFEEMSVLFQVKAIKEIFFLLMLTYYIYSMIISQNLFMFMF